MRTPTRSDPSEWTSAVEPGLARALEAVVTRTRPGRRIRSVTRSPLAQASSWWLERIRVELDDGSTVERLFKETGRDAPGSRAGETKPARVVEHTREAWIYRHVLSSVEAGAPECHVVSTSSPDDEGWGSGLLLEPVTGVRLSETAFGAPWDAAARLLARIHARGARQVPWKDDPLLDHGAALHRDWLSRALDFARDRNDGSVTDLALLVPAHRRAIALAQRGPSGFLHGEFYPSNVLVERGTGRIRPVDWEMGGLGPVTLDLAALGSGLSAPRRRRLAEGYRQAAIAEGLPLPEPPVLQRILLACRLLLAVQWLGWARDWTPPEDHRFNWMQEAQRCARELGS